MLLFLATSKTNQGWVNETNRQPKKKTQDEKDKITDCLEKLICQHKHWPSRKSLKHETKENNGCIECEICAFEIQNGML